MTAIRSSGSLTSLIPAVTLAETDKVRTLILSLASSVMICPTRSIIRSSVRAAWKTKKATTPPMKINMTPTSRNNLLRIPRRMLMAASGMRGRFCMTLAQNGRR